MLDPQGFIDLANRVTKIKPYPYLDFAHCAIVSSYIRDDLGFGGLAFSRKHPFSTWISTMISVFAGGFISNFLLGEPILSALNNNEQLFMATLVWYLIFYSPFDLVYKFVNFFPIKAVLAVLKEIYRCKKINDGVIHAAKLYPNGYLIMLIVGTIKGNGGGFARILERLVRGFWSPKSMETITPSFATKSSILVAFVLMIDKKFDIVSAPHSVIYLTLVIFVVYFKLSSLLLGIHEPFQPLENLICTTTLGGMVDALQRLIMGTNTYHSSLGSSSSGNSSFAAKSEQSASGDNSKQSATEISSSFSEKKRD